MKPDLEGAWWTCHRVNTGRITVNQVNVDLGLLSRVLEERAHQEGTPLRGSSPHDKETK